MTFDPFQISSCPLCGSELLHLSSSPADPYYEIYECPVHVPPRQKDHASRTHYFVSWDEGLRGAIKSEITIPGFHLMYSPDGTTIYKLETPPSARYHHVLSLNQIVPLDLSDLNKTAEKLKLIILFS